jgi:tRNA1Val (adenine37-N6)-methyltransferase
MRDRFLPGEDETLDSLSCGNLSIFQKKKGYRYSLDAYLLGAFVEETPGTACIEIGSGSGVVTILLAAM